MRDRRVLVVFEARPSARRALAAAVALDAPLTVVAVAPRDVRSARETAVREAAEDELREARAALGQGAVGASFVVLRIRREHELGEWAAGAGHTTALLGARRALLGLRPRDLRARSLARAGLEVQIVR